MLTNPRPPGPGHCPQPHEPPPTHPAPHTPPHTPPHAPPPRTPPQVFAEIPLAEISARSEGASTSHHHVLALRQRDDGSGTEPEVRARLSARAPTQHARARGSPQNGDRPSLIWQVLLFAAESARDKFEWIDALSRGARMMRCPLVKVAPMLALQMYGGCQDTTLGSVLQAPADVSSGVLVRHTKPGERPAPPPPAVPAPAGGPPRQRAVSGSSSGQWMVDRWIPDIFKNV